MRMIIGGKIYDTKTAKAIAARAAADLNRSDFCYWEEELFRTAKGAYFLQGEGGGLSRWAEHSAHGSGWGSRLEPLTEGRARDWMEAHASAEEYEATFGPADEA